MYFWYKDVMDLELGFMGFSLEPFIYDAAETDINTNLCDAPTFCCAWSLFQSCSVFLRERVWLL